MARETGALKAGLTNYIASIRVFHPADKEWIEVNCGYPQKKNGEGLRRPGLHGRHCRLLSAGRVAGGVYTLGNVKYYAEKNRVENTGHWGMKLIETAHVIGGRFSYLSPHMESGFPGEVNNYYTFTIKRSSPNALKTVYDSYIADNSTCDAVWEQPESVCNHWLRVPASRVAEADRMAIPTGEYLSVNGTPLDFRTGRVLEDGMSDPALDRDPCGYDHPLAIDGWEKGKLMLHAEARSPTTNICMKVYSTFPCMWVYTANNKPLPASGGPGQRYARWTGIGPEPQYFPDAAVSASTRRRRSTSSQLRNRSLRSKEESEIKLTVFTRVSWADKVLF